MIKFPVCFEVSDLVLFGVAWPRGILILQYANWTYKEKNEGAETHRLHMHICFAKLNGDLHNRHRKGQIVIENPVLL